MIDAKRFSGVLNTDDKPENVAGPQHIDAKNIRFYGGPSGLTAENIKGNYLINNAELPDGSNECIGSFFDSVNQRIIWFNYNSNGDNGIYQLDLQTEVVSKIFLCGTDSATDILNFSPDHPVHSSSLVYRTPGDGDLLYWTDGYNRPRYLNIDTVPTYIPFTEDMINAGKNAPLNELTLAYGTDTSIPVNNLFNNFFRFAYRFVYANLEKSTLSPTTSIPLPPGGFGYTFNNYIAISGVAELTGGNIGDIIAVEIIGQQSLGNVFGDYFIITRINSGDFTSGTSFSYNFVNDGSYVTLSPAETVLPFSFLPDKANTLELLNGNVLIYGGITEGYDNISQSSLDVLIYSGLSYGDNMPAVSARKINNTTADLIVGGNWVIDPLGPTGNAQVDIEFKWFDGTLNQTTNFNIIVPNVNTSLYDVTNYIWGVINASLSASFTVTQNGSATSGDNSNTITISCVAPVTITSITVLYVGYQNGLVGIPLQPQKAIPWSSKYRYGLVYFDERGKTNGVVSYANPPEVLNNFNYNSLDFNDYLAAGPGVSTGVRVPSMMASINHTPPTWAKKFQWVRTQNQNLSSYIQVITNDFQNPGDGYLYFGIQNLLYTQTQNTGFIPSYEFTQGDRMKIIARYYVTGEIVQYSQQLDLVIEGIAERTMNAPNTSTGGVGAYVKVKTPAGYPGTYGPYVGLYHFIQLYTPAIRSQESAQLYYEFGEAFDIIESSGNRYHAGNLTNQDNTQPATYLFYDGGSYYHSRNIYRNAGVTTSLITYQMMSTSYNDFFQSGVNSDSRGWPVDENARENYNSVLVRWGGKYQAGTNINELNIFQALSFDEVDRSKGDIRRFKSRDRILRVFQDRATGQYGVYMRFISNNQGQSELVTTNEIITTNNIQYYQGVYGVSGYPTNLVSTQNADYFVDVVTGRAIRLGGNGLIDLGLAYKGQFFLSQLVLPYNKSITRAGGFTSKVMGFFNYFDNQYNVLLQGSVSELIVESQSPLELASTYELYLNGTPKTGDVVNIELTDSLSTTQTYSYTVLSGDTVEDIIVGLVADINGGVDFVATVIAGSPYSHLEVVSAYPLITVEGNATIAYNTTGDVTPYNFSFNETRNGFCSFYDFHPEWATGANDMVYTWKDGEIWKHDDPTYCNFYGDQFGASLTTVFNSNLLIKKSWHSINEIASGVWAVPSMYTNVKTYGNTSQESNLVDAEFTILEGNPSSAIKRDANSQGGKINGDFMKGNYLVAKFEKQNASNYITLSEVSVRTTDSPLTAK